MRPVTARVTTASPIAYVRLDQYHGAALAVAVVIESGTSGAAYQIDYSFDDPNDLINPMPLASMAWDNSLIPFHAQSGSASTTFVIPTAPIWARVQILAGATSVRAIFTQYEAHRTMQVAPMPSSQMLSLP